jgi:hypothetical protein
VKTNFDNRQQSKAPTRPSSSEVAIITALNTQIDQLGTVVAAHFGQHPDAEVYASQPSLGTILAARVLGEFGDDPYRDAKAQKNYAGTSPITRASGTRKVVLARYAQPATGDWPTLSNNGPFCAGVDHLAPRRTTSNCGPGTSTASFTAA